MQLSLFSIFCFLFFFFFNDTATTEIYTLSYTTLFRSKSIEPLDRELRFDQIAPAAVVTQAVAGSPSLDRDRKSTRLNSSHRCISYAVFCLKKKKKMSPTCPTEQPYRHPPITFLSIHHS